MKPNKLLYNYIIAFKPEATCWHIFGSGLNSIPIGSNMHHPQVPLTSTSKHIIETQYHLILVVLASGSFEKFLGSESVPFLLVLRLCGAANSKRPSGSSGVQNLRCLFLAFPSSQHLRSAIPQLGGHQSGWHTWVVIQLSLIINLPHATSIC